MTIRHNNSRLERFPVQGKLAGVCAGLAHYWGFSRFWLRIVALVMLFSMPMVMIPGYLVAAFLMPAGDGFGLRY